jgi:hypothetical protein
MDFTFTEEQETIAKVARQQFEHRATPEHLTELEAGDVRYDATSGERTLMYFSTAQSFPVRTGSTATALR